LLSLLEQLHEVGGTRGVAGLAEIANILPLRQDGARGEGSVSLEQSALGALPAQLGNVATASLKDSAGLFGVVLVDEVCDEGHNPVRLQVLQHLRGHDGLGHARSGNRSNGVGENAILETLLGEGLSEADKSELSG